MSPSDSTPPPGAPDDAAPELPPSQPQIPPVPPKPLDVTADVPDEIADLGDLSRRREDDSEGGIIELDLSQAPETSDAMMVEVAPDAPAATAESELAEPTEAPPPSVANRVVVRYGQMQDIGEFRHNLTSPPAPGRKVVIRSERGVELGEVLMGLCDSEDAQSSSCRRCISGRRLGDFIHDSGPEYPYHRDGKILRMANAQDVGEQRHLDGSAREEATYARQQIRELNLPMRLVTVEHLLGGERIIFYFSSEARVDFRELVRRLATQFRTRIEMRQVGARDEARLVADYERCGQRCCCQQFLKNLKPVSMRMAKTQKATLDPSKISGRCGRLMCCLRYEDLTYEDLRKKLPRKNTWVTTAAGVTGKVIDTQIITQLVRLWLVDNSQVVVANEEIQARDVPPPPMPTIEERRPREKKEKGPPRLLREEFGKSLEKPDVQLSAKDITQPPADVSDAPDIPLNLDEVTSPTSEGEEESLAPQPPDVADDGEENVDEEDGQSAPEGQAPSQGDAQPPPQGQRNSQSRPPLNGLPPFNDRRGQGGQNHPQRQGQRPQGQPGQPGQQQGEGGRRRRRRRRGRRGGGGGGPQGQGGGGVPQGGGQSS